jgi:ActR/RegA family two-component response regulator
MSEVSNSSTAAGNVLLVEDDKFLRLLVKDALERKGIQIIFDTSSVSEALMFAKELRPQSAIVDYNLGPGPNGIDLANELRKLDPDIGIVLLTTYRNPTELPMGVAKIPQGTRFVNKECLSDIAILIKEIEAAAPEVA